MVIANKNTLNKTYEITITSLTGKDSLIITLTSFSSTSTWYNHFSLFLKKANCLLQSSHQIASTLRQNWGWYLIFFYLTQSIFQCNLLFWETYEMLTYCWKEISRMACPDQDSFDSCSKLNPSCPNHRPRKKINLNFSFHTFLWCLKRFYEGLKGLHKTFWGTTKKCENKNLD